MRTCLFVTAILIVFASGGARGEAQTACGCLGSIPPGSHVLLICPQGDGPTLSDAGAVITLT